MANNITPHTNSIIIALVKFGSNPIFFKISSRNFIGLHCNENICIHKHIRRVKNEVTHTRHIEGKRQNKVLALYSTRTKLSEFQ